MARSGTRGTPRHTLSGRPTRPDPLIFLSYAPNGEIIDAVLDEFCTIEHAGNGFIKITLIGVDETKPVVLMLESKTRIIIRPFGEKIDD